MLGETGSGSQNEGFIARLEAEVEQMTALVAQKDALLVKANQRAEQAHRGCVDQGDGAANAQAARELLAGHR